MTPGDLGDFLRELIDKAFESDIPKDIVIAELEYALRDVKDGVYDGMD